MRRQRLSILVAAVVMVGCKCDCSNVVVGGDGGTGGHGAGNGGGAAGTGGGSGVGGNGGSGAGNTDGGDGTTTQGFGPDAGDPFVLDGGDGSTASGVKLDPNGNIVLNSGSQQFFFMWIANNEQGWVSKYDTRTAKEVGRYWSVVPKDCANSAGPPCAGGALQPLLTYDQGNNPSRTAIDLNGDVWIANRAVGHQGSVTKIANDVSGCIDRNGDGKIETSKDLDGDGNIDPTICVNGECEMIMPTNKNDPLTYDECVLFSTPIATRCSTANDCVDPNAWACTNGVCTGGTDVQVRGIAISKGQIEGGPGDIWAANYNEKHIYKLNNVNGQMVPTDGVSAPFITITYPFGPYGLIVDSQQRLWAVKYPSAPVDVALIDTTTGAVIDPDIQSPADCGSYALGIDGKDRFWVPGWSVNASVACRYDRATNTWQKFDLSNQQCVGGGAQPFGRPRGIAVDDMGQVYMSADSPGAQLIRFDAETGAVIPFGTAPCIDATDTNTNTSIGVALDGDGNPWVNNYSGNAMKVDKVTGAVTKTAQQPAGLYTYSDFTGYELRNFTAPRGTYTKDFMGCSMQTDWKKIEWTAVTPSGTAIQVFVKVGDTQADLSNPATMQYGPFTTSPTDLDAAGVPHKQWARVIFVLLTNNGMTTPVLTGYDFVWSCSIEIQ
jgi:hypothetical protein